MTTQKRQRISLSFDDAALLFGLGILTEDRADEEQAALLRLAWALGDLNGAVSWAQDTWRPEEPA